MCYVYVAMPVELSVSKCPDLPEEPLGSSLQDPDFRARGKAERIGYPAPYALRQPVYFRRTRSTSGFGGFPLLSSRNIRIRLAASTASGSERSTRADWFAPGVRGEFDIYNKPFVSLRS